MANRFQNSLSIHVNTVRIKKKALIARALKERKKSAQIVLAFSAFSFDKTNSFYVTINKPLEQLYI